MSFSVKNRFDRIMLGDFVQYFRISHSRVRLRDKFFRMLGMVVDKIKKLRYNKAIINMKNLYDTPIERSLI